MFLFLVLFCPNCLRFVLDENGFIYIPAAAASTRSYRCKTYMRDCLLKFSKFIVFHLIYHYPSHLPFCLLCLLVEDEIVLKQELC